MKRVLVTAALVWAGAAALLLAQSARPRQAATATRAQSLTPSSEAAKYRAWVNQYCVGCHNSSTANPALTQAAGQRQLLAGLALPRTS